MSEKKYVYTFGGSKTEGDGSMKNLLGGKGANLAEMAKLGLPVPPGFTVSTECCVDYFKSGDQLPAGTEKQVLAALKHPRKPIHRGVRVGVAHRLVQRRYDVVVLFAGLVVKE